jgi:hypothetical protein
MKYTIKLSLSLHIDKFPLTIDCLSDYNLDYSREPAYFDGQSPARCSDHSPVLLGLDLSSTPTEAPTATPTMAPTKKPIASTSTLKPITQTQSTKKPVQAKATKKPESKATKAPKQPEAKATKAPEAKAAKEECLTDRWQ